MPKILNDELLKRVKETEKAHNEAVEAMQSGIARALTKAITEDEAAPALLKYMIETFKVEKIYYATIHDQRAANDYCDYFVFAGENERIAIRAEGTCSEFYDESFFEFEAFDNIMLEEILEDDFEGQREEGGHPPLPEKLESQEALTYLHKLWAGIREENDKFFLSYPYSREVDFNDDEAANFPH